MVEVQASSPLLARPGHCKFGRMIAGHKDGIDFVLPVGQELLDFAIRLIRLDHVHRKFGPAPPGFGTVHDILVDCFPGRACPVDLVPSPKPPEADIDGVNPINVVHEWYGAIGAYLSPISLSQLGPFL